MISSEMIHKIIELTEEFITSSINYLHGECQKLDNVEETFKNSINDITKYPETFFQGKLSEMESDKLFKYIIVYLKDAYKRYNAFHYLETMINIDKIGFMRNLLINVGLIFIKNGCQDLQKAHKTGVKRTLLNMIPNEVYDNFIKVEPREENKPEEIIAGEINKLVELGNIEEGLGNLLAGLMHMDESTSENTEDDLSDIKINNIEIETPEQYGGGIPSFKDDSIMQNFERNENHVVKPPEYVRGNIVAQSLNEVFGVPQRSIFNSMNEDGTSRIEEL